MSRSLLIVAQVAWRAQFLSQMYFYRQDFFDLDFAITSPFNWHYLTYVGTGHVMIGERAIIWVLARISLYNWTLASAVSLLFLAGAGFAAFLVLRTLFGERPAILVPLAIYLLSPLGVAALGWWTVALESVPLQLALFMALNSHIHYVRTRRTRHLLAASGWVLFAMLAFEKGLVVPVLLFAVTSAFLCGGGSWLSGMRRALVGCWRAWAVYAVAFIAYLLVLDHRAADVDEPAAGTEFVRGAHLRLGPAEGLAAAWRDRRAVGMVVAARTRLRACRSARCPRLDRARFSRSRSWSGRSCAAGSPGGPG